MRSSTPILHIGRAAESPRRPTSVNFQVNDICNARCVMCRIWERRRTTEMNPDAFGHLLRDPFFSEVRHVGITGGEPTLRRDLPAFYSVAATSCKQLAGASFITHGLDTDRAIAAYQAVAREYEDRRLDFHGMVSLDGLGQVHDTIRGKVGAFERSTRTLFGLKAAGVPTSACCTIVKSNVWHLWDLLEWGFNKTYIRFRVGEFINRLGNLGCTDQIRSFDDAETAELISFFETLIRGYETDASVKRTYASIVSLLSGGTRLIGCSFQRGEAINIDCRGEFAVCAPKGVPRPLAPSPAAAVATADAERERIAARHCDECIHDYHDEWRPDVAAILTDAALVEQILVATGA